MEKRKEDGNSLVIKKDNSFELDFINETLETIIEDGGKILNPSIISINDLNGKFVKKGKKSFMIVYEVGEEQENFFKDKDSIFLTFVLQKNKK